MIGLVSEQAMQRERAGYSAKTKDKTQFMEENDVQNQYPL